MTLSLRPGALALLVAACAAPAPRPEAGGPGPVMRAARAAEECVIVGDRAAAGDTFTVALPGAVSPARAPVPETPAERFLFRALYETLIELDCAERVLPGLAEAWASEDGGRRWTFVLRGDARFWDGEPVTAHDVAAAWAARDTLGEFAPWDGPVAQAVQVMSERVIAVRLRWPYSEVPRALTHPGLAVAKAAPGLRWPIGTGRYWLSESGRQMALVPAFGDALPVLRFQPLDGGDARDLLDAGADLLVTDDPAALSYAGRRPDLGVVPLPWDRTYLFVPGPDVPAPAESGRL
ncbi:MAG TPA: ABC transporter substrate-binding protein, partial [Gemmatimonadales bacterium]|nr:ABC transporter substrate-binding protein [Gemmatimonadales bacterium]